MFCCCAGCSCSKKVTEAARTRRHPGVYSRCTTKVIFITSTHINHTGIFHEEKYRQFILLSRVWSHQMALLVYKGEYLGGGRGGGDKGWWWLRKKAVDLSVCVQETAHDWGMLVQKHFLIFAQNQSICMHVVCMVGVLGVCNLFSVCFSVVISNVLQVPEVYSATQQFATTQDVFLKLSRLIHSFIWCLFLV